MGVDDTEHFEPQWLYRHVWINQGIDNQHQFLNVFEKRGKDILYCQDWRSETDSVSRCFMLSRNKYENKKTDRGHYYAFNHTKRFIQMELFNTTS